MDGRPTIEQLRGFAAFADLDDTELQALGDASAIVRVAAQTRLIEEGADDDALYLVLDGQLSVEDGSGPLAALGPGDVVGETATTPSGHGFRRTATVRARSAATVVEIPGEAVRRLQDANPSLRAHFASLRSQRISFESLTRHLRPGER